MRASYPPLQIMNNASRPPSQKLKRRHLETILVPMMCLEERTERRLNDSGVLKVSAFGGTTATDVDWLLASISTSF